MGGAQFVDALALKGQPVLGALRRRFDAFEQFAVQQAAVFGCEWPFLFQDMNIDLPAIGKTDMGSGRGKQLWKAGGNALLDARQQLAQAAGPFFRQFRLPELSPDGFAVEFEIGFGGEHGEEKIRLLRQGELRPRRQQSRSSEQA
ncbi:hypothetical protein ACVIOG_006046 [Rhizobium leguminosarum]